MNCQLFFETHKGSKNYCKELQKYSEQQQIAWEMNSAFPAISPGIVINEEILCRQVIDPVHFDQVTGTIKPTFFDDASNKGASCHRLKHISIEVIKEITLKRVAEANINPPSTGPRVAIGIATLNASEVRGIMTAGISIRRGAGIYDTAKDDDASHADICQLVSGRIEGISIRAQLFKMAKDRLIYFASEQTA
jgi:hypothetical protein